MSEVSDLIMNEAGLEFPKASIQFEIFKNPRGSLSIQGGIKYRGPVRPQVGLQQMQRIKIDLTLDEALVLPPVIKSVDHPYSDRPDLLVQQADRSQEADQFIFIVAESAKRNSVKKRWITT